RIEVLEYEALTVLAEIHAAERDVPLERVGGSWQVFLDNEGWWYQAAGVRWFMTIHSQLYPPSHSRYWPLAGTLIAFIPEAAFQKLFDIGVPDAIRLQVRQSFALRGQRYPFAGGAIASLEEEERTGLADQPGKTASSGSSYLD